MIDANLVALLALAILAVLLSIYLLKIDDNVGHLSKRSKKGDIQSRGGRFH